MESPRRTTDRPSRRQAQARIRLAPLTLLAALALLARPAASQTVGPPSPAVGTSGTLLSVALDGLGDAPPKVWLTRDDTKKRTRLKLVEASPTSLTLLLKRAPAAGTYDLTVQPKGGDALELDGAFTVASPQQLVLVPPVAMPQQTVAIQGAFLGDRKGSVRIGGRRAKVLAWQAELGVPADDESVPPGQVLVRLPKQLTDGLHAVELSNAAGSALTEVALGVTGSDVAPQGKQPRLIAQIGDGLVDTKKVSHVAEPFLVKLLAVVPGPGPTPGFLTLRLVVDTDAPLPGSLTQADDLASLEYVPPLPADGSCGTCPRYVSNSCTVTELELAGSLLRAQFQAELIDALGLAPPLTLQAGHVTTKLDTKPPALTPVIKAFTPSTHFPAVGESVVYDFEIDHVDPTLTSWTLEVPLGVEPIPQPVSGVTAHAPLNAVDYLARLHLYQAGQEVAQDTLPLYPEGMFVGISSPEQGKPYDEVLHVSISVLGAELGVAEARATVGDLSLTLIPDGGVSFAADLPLDSLSPGLHELVVTVEDGAGHVAQTAAVFDYDNEPTLTVTGPEAGAVAMTSLGVQASGSDADSDSVTLSVLIKPPFQQPILLASAEDVLDTVLDLSPWDGLDVDLVVRLEDGTWTQEQTIPIFVEGAQGMQPLVFAPGELIDVSQDGTRIVYIDEDHGPAHFVRADLALETQESVPLPEGYELVPQLGSANVVPAALTPTGLLYRARPVGVHAGQVHLVDWNDGALIVLSESLASWKVTGDYAAFGHAFDPVNLLSRWRFSSRTLDEFVTGAIDSTLFMFPGLPKFVTHSGDLYWIDGEHPYQIVRQPDGQAATQLSSQDWRYHSGLTADGQHALYARRKHNGPNPQYELLLHDGTAEVVVREFQPYGSAGWHHALAGDWIAFSRKASVDSKTIWTRDPAGVETLVSEVPYGSGIARLADDGTMVLRWDGRYVLWRGSGPLEELGSDQGRLLRRGDQWYVLLSHILFRVP